MAGVDNDQTLVDCQTEDAILTAVDAREEKFVADMVDFGTSYRELVRYDYGLFVDAFRNGKTPGVGEV